MRTDERLQVAYRYLEYWQVTYYWYDYSQVVSDGVSNTRVCVRRVSLRMNEWLTDGRMYRTVLRQLLLYRYS